MNRTHNNDIQLSRISRVSHPRATIWATLLLVVVFLGFGVWAQAHIVELPEAEPGTMTETTTGNITPPAQAQE